MHLDCDAATIEYRNKESEMQVFPPPSPLPAMQLLSPLHLHPNNPSP